ncbi:P-loop containing nucleoside triphosphate hydrolase protein [Pluteus cervinus]|uniref:P-loop containing nucleoside triphosphate hydrolase protein n=1 Tax=Pluteus cervinus TaxID=181527 RepID=A0ACD3B6B9_9AGAR|nr:P-loop containing nucleoside triphosphate hydrolase protein [Pluteus cervinus]
MVLTHIPMPGLPVPPSWFPGHMMKFTRMLPALLTRTDVVLEVRDSRLPLTSINRTLEGALQKWRMERGWDPNDPSRRILDATACERIVVFNKRDLVPEWGIEPFRKATGKRFPGQSTLFASLHRPRDIRNLSEMLINIAKRYPHAMELNVLVIGMPNVGKSTLLNALRNSGIKGRTPKALQTSAQPGLTQALSTRLKLSLDPLVYAFDSPGVMLPFLGCGPEGAERGVKLALIAGIKEGMYDMETLAAYLHYRLNVLNPISPAYLKLLPSNAQPTADLQDFLTQLAQRMGMIRRGAQPDLSRAAVYFIRWWREEGGLLAASSAFLPATKRLGLGQGQGRGAQVSMEGDIATPIEQTGSSLLPASQGWGFDFEWDLQPTDLKLLSGSGDVGVREMVQAKMEGCIDQYLEMTEREDREELNVSPTQKKKQMVMEEKAKRKIKQARKRLAKSGS